MFYSASTGGFYDEAIHGSRSIDIIDPSWVRPKVNGAPDMDAIPPTITIANAASKIPVDSVSLTPEQYASLLAGQSEGKVIVPDERGFPVLQEPPAPSSAQLEAHFIDIIQRRLDAFAQERNYDSILAACSYSTSSVAKFRTEGQTCVTLRDSTWTAAYDILGKVRAGLRTLPSNIAEIESDLPLLVWP